MDFDKDLDFSAVCRTCLGTKDLNPLFKRTVYAQRFSETMLKVTGLKVAFDDGLPQKICKLCLQQIRKSLSFQMNCRRAERKLKIQSNYINFIANKHKNLHSNKNTENASENNEVVIKTETLEEEMLELETEVLNFLPHVEMLKKEEIKDEGTKDDNVIRSVNEFENNYDIVEPEARDDKTERRNDTQTDCKFCQKQFPTQDILVKHIPKCKSVMAAREKKQRSVWGKDSVECSICNLKMQRASLKSHTKIKHAGLGPVCDHCGNKFSNKFRLNEHMRSKHGFAKFKCSHCEFESATTVGMANHERRHRGEKPFVCEVCGASFHAAYLMSQHKKSHRTERLLKCELCPSNFKSNNGLHTHRAACHGVSRHTCPECERTYRSRHYLVRHMRTVHRFMGAVPAQPDTLIDIESKQHFLPTAGNMPSEVPVRVEPVQALSWIDIESERNFLPTAGNRPSEGPMREPVQAESLTDS